MTDVIIGKKEGDQNTVIRIGGTSFSGSTLLDLMISNDDNAFSCGEVHHLFYPDREQYYQPECSCLNKSCNIWNNVKQKGENELWDSILKFSPNVYILIDSSKNVDWFLQQASWNTQNKYNLVNILIWKTPAEFAYSCLKRGEINTWKIGYINYHLTYFRNIDKWISVKYNELATNPAEKLQNICDAIKIPYFPGKEIYWNREYHTLFGSNTAKLHLYDIDSKKFNKIIADREKHQSMTDGNIQRAYKYHRTFFPSKGDPIDKLPASACKEIKESRRVKLIEQILEMTEVDSTMDSSNLQDIIEKIRYIKPPLYKRLAKRIAKIIRS